MISLQQIHADWTWFNDGLMFAGILFALVKWRLSWILATVKYLNYSLTTQLSWAYLENQRQTYKSWSTSCFVSKIISIYCFDLHKWWPFWILLTIRWLKYVLATPLCQTCLETPWCTPNLWFCFYSVNLLLHLAQMTAILDSIHNAIFKVLSDYITMSGITKTCMLDIMNLCLFYLK